MRYTQVLNFPGHGIADVAAMMADPDFASWVAQQAAPDGVVDLAEVAGTAADGFTVTVRRRVPASVIPPHLQRFVGDELELRQAEVWEPERDGRRTGTVALEITGTPVIMAGTAVLRPGEGGAVVEYQGTVEAGVPLIGPMIEAAAEQPVRAGMLATERAANEWLAGRR